MCIKHEVSSFESDSDNLVSNYVTIKSSEFIWGFIKFGTVIVLGITVCCAITSASVIDLGITVCRAVNSVSFSTVCCVKTSVSVTDISLSAVQ